ncbi:MAG TPA: hypothetical protein VN796_08395 [Acidimicrobiales bacterium]|nr:hypothetical protein [Acidimicrobiales bacterium]
MHRHSIHGASVLLLVTLVIGGVAGGAWAKTPRMAKPTLTSALSSSSIPPGGNATDTATVTGTAAKGAPTGSVTFSVCGPTAGATPCTAPNAGSATVGLSTGAHHRSTASVILEPGSPGWYCFLDQYSGDSHYKAVSDNNTATECLDVTGGGGGSTPTITSALSPSSIGVGGTATDTATVTGKAAHGSPTGTLTFSVCGPTAKAAPCTSPNLGPVTVGLTEESGNRSVASVGIQPGSPGWYCFLDQYSGDANYSAVSDNDASTECLDVTGGGGGSTPTITSAVSPSSIQYGNTAIDTITVTGNASGGSPTGTVTVYACGPTSSATRCTSPNIGPAVVTLSLESGDRSTGSATIDPGSPGWYCFLDQYNGDSHYSTVSDNDPATECLDVTSGANSVHDRGVTTLKGSAAATGGPARTTLTPIAPRRS